ncbi:unnamed protein product [Hapterophycus canaliculatus]
MWSRRLPVLLSTLLWSTQAFFVPPSCTNKGHVRFRSQGQDVEVFQYQQPSARCSGRAAVDNASISRHQRQRTGASAAVMSDTGSACGRKAFLTKITGTAAGAVLAAAAVAPKMSEAKEAAVDTPVDWTAEFGEVKRATDLVLSDLRGLTTKGEWAQLMEQAKGYDQSMRKG